MPGPNGAPSGTAPRARPLRIGLFGAFHPMSDRAGGSSTGMAVLFEGSARVAHVTVFGTAGSTAPEHLALPHLTVLPIWSPDRPRTLLKALRAMTRRAGELDGYVFNIYPTSFGRFPPANGLGMLLPVFVAKLTRRPVVVFMHNFVESQDLTRLGYEVSPLAVRAAMWLEARVARSTIVVTGLPSVAEAARTALRAPVRLVPFRFVDSVAGLLAEVPHPTSASGPPSAEDPLKILLFGSWGPQKDLEGALALLRPWIEGGANATVTVAGAANPNFPPYIALLERLARELPKDGFRFIGRVEDTRLAEVFRGHDVLLLPYHATGGYSGVMNLGAAFGIQVVAYDHAQLREFAGQLGIDAQFVPPNDGEAVRRALLEAGRRRTRRSRDTEGRLAIARAGTEAILDLLGAPPAPAGAVP
ncbi:MAG TPA: glycosyltransferase [Thermoplasmata archaeon]|nr:glycosyltransferase [Thermoplasmata archaeon]